MPYRCPYLTKRFIILYTFIIASVSIGWVNITFAQTDSYNIMLVHFPPLQNDPTLTEQTLGLGLTNELWDLANPQNVARQNRKYYPPSRIYQMAAKDMVEVFSAAQFMIRKYNLLKYYRCTGNVLNTTSILYQNLNIEPTEMKDLSTELVGKNILLAKESKNFFENIIPQDNQILPVIQPRNMAKMFMLQRQPYMLDFQSRAESGLKTPQFAIKRYVLMRAKNSICVTKQRPDLFSDIMKQYWNFRKMQGTPEAQRLEKKYNFNLTWGLDEEELQPK